MGAGAPGGQLVRSATQNCSGQGRPVTEEHCREVPASTEFSGLPIFAVAVAKLVSRIS